MDNGTDEYGDYDGEIDEYENDREDEDVDDLDDSEGGEEPDDDKYIEKNLFGGIKRYEDKMDSKQFESKIKIDNDSKNWPCPDCYKTFDKKMKLVAHRRVHKVGKNLANKIANGIENDVDDPSDSSINPKKLEMGSFKCQGCSKTYVYNKAYVTHILKCTKYTIWKKENELRKKKLTESANRAIDLSKIESPKNVFELLSNLDNSTSPQNKDKSKQQSFNAESPKISTNVNVPVRQHPKNIIPIPSVAKLSNPIPNQNLNLNLNARAHKNMNPNMNMSTNKNVTNSHHNKKHQPFIVRLIDKNKEIDIKTANISSNGDEINHDITDPPKSDPSGQSGQNDQNGQNQDNTSIHQYKDKDKEMINDNIKTGDPIEKSFNQQNQNKDDNHHDIDYLKALQRREKNQKIQDTTNRFLQNKSTPHSQINRQYLPKYNKSELFKDICWPTIIWYSTDHHKSGEHGGPKSTTYLPNSIDSNLDFYLKMNNLSLV